MIDKLFKLIKQHIQKKKLKEKQEIDEWIEWIGDQDYFVGGGYSE